MTPRSARVSLLSYTMALLLLPAAVPVNAEIPRPNGSDAATARFALEAGDGFCLVCDYTDFRAAGYSFPDLVITSPLQGEVLQAGTHHRVTWNYSGLTGKVKILLGPPPSYYLLGEVPVTDGQFEWTSNSCMLGSSSSIRIEASQDSQTIADEKQVSFVDDEPIQIKLNSPNGGELLHPFDPCTVSWTTNARLGHIQLDLVNAWGQHQFLANLPLEPSQYTWILGASDAYSSTDRHYRLSISTSSNDCLAQDESDAPFIIAETPGMPHLLTPNGDEVFQPTDMVRISWTPGNIASSEYVLIFLVTDGYPDRILDAIPASNRECEIPACQMYPPGDHRIRIQGNRSTGQQDVSDATFEVLPENMLQFTSPIPGQIISAGDTQTVSWNYSGPSYSTEFMLLQFALFKGNDGVATVGELESFSSGSIEWPVCPLLPAGDDYSIHCFWSDVASGCEHNYQSPTFTITNDDPATLKLLNPTPGEQLEIGTTHQIRWESRRISSVSVRLYRNGNLIKILGNAPANAGSLDWSLCDEDPGTGYSINISTGGTSCYCYYPSDQCDGLEIVSGNEATVLSPNGGEVIQPGTVQRITWQSSLSSGTVQVDLLQYGYHRANLGQVSITDGEINWPICPDTHGLGYQIELSLVDSTGCSVLDRSDGQFEISGSPGNMLALTNPAGGEVLRAGDTYRITWTSGFPSGDVDLEIGCQDCGTPRVRSIFRVADLATGYFDWTVCPGGSPGSEYWIGIIGHSSDGCSMYYGSPRFAIEPNPRDLNSDCTVTQADISLFEQCDRGPAMPIQLGCLDRDFDHDGDVDQSDFGLLQEAVRE